MGASTARPFLRACRICACLEKRNRNTHDATLDMVTHSCLTALTYARLSTHAKTATISLATSIPAYAATTVSRRSRMCLHKRVEPLDFQRSKPRYDCTRQRCPSFGDRSLAPTILPKPMAATCASVSLSLSNPARDRWIWTNEAHGIHRSLYRRRSQFDWPDFRKRKAGITALARKPHRRRLSGKIARIYSSSEPGVHLKGIRKHLRRSEVKNHVSAKLRARAHPAITSNR